MLAIAVRKTDPAGMSKRTAEKHLEHIFAKPGVETRGATATILRKL
jgi:DNA-binding CsgD family transcriptional regulator